MTVFSFLSVCPVLAHALVMLQAKRGNIARDPDRRLAANRNQFKVTYPAGCTLRRERLIERHLRGQRQAVLSVFPTFRYFNSLCSATVLNVRDRSL